MMKEIFKRYGLLDLRFDVGADGENLMGLLAFDNLLGKQTWERPNIQPTGVYAAVGPTYEENKLSYHIQPLCVSFSFQEMHGALAINACITNESNKVVWLNGFTFDLVLPLADGARFYFPANVPHGRFKIDTLEVLHTVEAGLVNFAVAFEGFPHGSLNLICINEEEKWATGVWRQEEIHAAFCAHTEGDIPPGQHINVGTVYVQPTGTEEQLPMLRQFVEKLGFFPPTDGCTDKGVMYSCHPYGTMDSDFNTLQEDLFKFAERLPDLAQMGVQHIWLLPMFDHNEDGVYHSNDQDIIDERYGGEEGARFFCEKARELGMNVLFDYVPHGPVPSHPLAKDNPDWCAKKRDGSLQIEWKCVSMDYNNPGYLAYTTDLAAGHAMRFGINGARIDCAMGGLSNWQPQPGKRPSSSSVSAGVKISKAIRDGFIREGIKPLNMPENFNPIPPYYPHTDLFYGFNLYRVFCELEPLFLSNPAQYAAELMEWLKDESLVLPADLGKLRFLGNHDTVSWVWQARRATDIYGVEGAKALWALITLIDGTPMIYQGDEDPAIYGKPEGPNLKAFFMELFKNRTNLAQLEGTEYLKTETALFAFIRGGKYLVLVNLGTKEERFRGYVVRPYEYGIYEV